MFARHLSMKSTPENRTEIEALADDVFHRAKSIDGFVTIHFLVSEDETTYGAISLWKTRRDAQVAGDQLRAYSQDRIAKLATEPPVETYYEIYKPKT
ncbi:MAG: hypothetical protein DWQ08_09130 [Proteobacteria bacterium]|nr:MAG: hypothetical protein DWQ08_09130 [Pseudomonadota bacterium]